MAGYAIIELDSVCLSSDAKYGISGSVGLTYSVMCCFLGVGFATYGVKFYYKLNFFG